MISWEEMKEKIWAGNFILKQTMIRAINLRFNV